ncbi:MAG: response regulator [Butyrivibrio sp.]|nr:response regulator [Butyrivibrio sp.]
MREFSVLLVDDEELALVGLEEGVDWGNVDVQKIYKSHSRDTAIRMLKTYAIDIIITDIEMPGGTGLELIHWVKENKPEVEAIFYTGHAEFAYVQEALRLGAVDYLLKPIEYPALEKIISEIEKKIYTREKEVDFKEFVDDLTEESQVEVVDQVKQLIAENISLGNLQREELANMVHLSPGYLSRIFKKETGMPLSDYIIQKRIAIAKQLLTKTNLPITTIAERIGLSYASYFTKLFKEKVNMTPQEFRQNAKSGKGNTE